MSKLKDLTNWSKLEGLLADEEAKGKRKSLDAVSMHEHLKTRVKGQDAILEDVAKLISLNAAKSKRSRPICNLLFLGPTGTGKTELAKAISEFIFEDEKAMLRFDCSELVGDHTAKTRLVGMPVGYKGAEQGGQLTRPVLANPKRMVLFDEIEKANPAVFDLFLQMMGEGRLTDQSTGKLADFTQSIIVLTSNAHAEEIAKLQEQTSDYHEMLNSVKSYLADANVFRPEIVGRIDKIYVFKPLEGMVVAEIALLKITKLAEEYGLEVELVAPELILTALRANKKVSRFGIRELERIIFEMLASQMAAIAETKVKSVKIECDAAGEIKVSPGAAK